MNITALFFQMFTLFLIILVGFIAAKLKYMDDDVNNSIARLVAFVISPLQILSSVLKPGNHPISNLTALKITGIAFAMYIIMIFAAKLLPKLLRTKGKEAGCYEYMFIFSNIGYMGYPVIDALFGNEYRFYGTIFILAFDLFCWTYGVAIMSGEKLKFDKKLFLRPMIIAAILAYFLYFSKLGMRCPEIIYNLTSKVGDMTAVLAMLIIGCSLAQISMKEIFGKWRTYVMAVLKMILLPIVIWSILRLFIKDTMILGVVTVISAMPVATNSTIISYQFGGDKNLSSSGVFITTLMAVVTVPVLMTVLF